MFFEHWTCAIMLGSKTISFTALRSLQSADDVDMETAIRIYMRNCAEIGAGSRGGPTSSVLT